MSSDNITVMMAVICGIILICMVFSRQVKVILKLCLNSLVGAVVIYIANLAMAPLGISVGINIFTLGISAFLGIPGAIAIVAAMAIL